VPAHDVPGPEPWVGRRAAVLAALTTSLVLAAWLLRRTWGSGEYLFRDYVAVPDPARPDSWLPTSSAELRAWPLDAVTWALSGVVPTGVQQALMLGGCLVLAGTGAGVLAARYGAAAASAAAAVAVWNPYVTERLLLGQPPTLMGYAAMPWVFLVARTGPPTPRRAGLLLLAAAPAAVTPWGGLVVLVAAVAGALLRRGRTLGDVAVVAGIGTAWCLPWLLPGLVAGGPPPDPDGARAFSLADDTGLGAWPSALLGGGVWAQAAQPLSRHDPLALTASVVVLVAGLVGAALVWRSAGRRQGSLALAVVLAPACLLALTSGPLLGVVESAQSIPGAALVRDQHRLLAPSVMAVAVLVGVVVGATARAGGPAAATGSAILALVVAGTTVPDLPQRVRSAYVPRAYPDGWSAVVRAVDADPGPQRVLSLPWQPLRATPWSGERAFLDPLPRALGDPVLTSSALTVRREDVTFEVDDRPVPAGAAWREGRVSTQSLRDAGVTVVVEWLRTPGALAESHDGWRLVVRTEDFVVWDVSSAD
jgi:hypothetical protein